MEDYQARVLGARCVVGIYARYSTDLQNPTSIDDQMSSCERLLRELQIVPTAIRKFHDAAVSGETAERDGLGRALDAIRNGEIDILVADEISRFSRHSTRVMEIIETAVDFDVRVLTVQDRLDTNDSRWRLNGHFGAIKAELDNEQTRHRIARARRGNWERGFAVGGPVHGGYARVPAGRGLDDPNVRFPDYRRKQTASNVKILGPFVDVRVDDWTPVIVKAFRLIAEGEPPWSVANYLNAAGLPLPSKSGRDRWTRYSVIALVKHPIYRGVEEFGRTRTSRKLRTGTTTVHRAPDQDVWRRKREDLRHVSDELWYRANDVIHARTRGRTQEQKQVRRHRAPRDRRRSLSTIFVCGVCDSPMHSDGKVFFCGDARLARHDLKLSHHGCWNRISVRCSIVYAAIGAAIADALTSSEAALRELFERAVALARDSTGQVRQRIERLEQEREGKKRVIQRLLTAIETSDENSELVERLRERQADLRAIEGELAELARLVAKPLRVPTEAELQGTLASVRERLLEADPETVGPLLRRLTPKIRAVPHKVFDMNMFVLRAKFELQLPELIEPEARGHLREAANSADSHAVSKVPCVVNLFRTPVRFEHLSEFRALLRQGCSTREAARALGIAPHNAKRARRAAVDMMQLDLTDPYIELQTMPATPPGRWRPRTGRPDVFDERGEGSTGLLARSGEGPTPTASSARIDLDRRATE